MVKAHLKASDIPSQNEFVGQVSGGLKEEAGQGRAGRLGMSRHACHPMAQLQHC